MIPAGAQSIQFTAEWLNNAGADRYSLVGGQATPKPVPEPSTGLLLGAGLAMAFWFRRRRV